MSDGPSVAGNVGVWAESARSVVFFVALLSGRGACTYMLLFAYMLVLLLVKLSLLL